MKLLSIRHPVVLVLAIVLTPPVAIGQSVAPLSPERHGPHRVGFTVRWIDPDTTGRPGRLLIWYPADTGGTSLRFGDYLEAGGSGGATDWAAALAARELDTGRRQFSPASDSLWSALAMLPVAARRDPRPAPGAHRLVLHLLGLGDWSLESTLLWERLASEGFIVGVVSQLPETPEGGFSFGIATIQRQMADAERGLAALRRLPGARAEDATLMGHSSGGLEAVLLASRLDGIGRVVALDGSAGTRDGVAVLDSLGWSPSSLRVPFLDVYRVANSVRDLSKMRQVSSRYRTAVRVGGLRPPDIITHFDFQNWPVYSTALEVPDPRGEPARPAARAAEVYRTVAEIVATWLDAGPDATEQVRAVIAGRPADVAPIALGGEPD